MPYVNDSNLKKDDEQSAQDGQAPTLPGSSDAAGGDFGGQAHPAPAGPTQSGRFVNLQGYLNANAGQNFGGQVAGKVQSTVDQANAAQSDADSQFKSRVDQNAVAADPNLVNQATNDPGAVANDPSKMAAWQQQYNASYGGPQTFSDAQDLYNSSSGQVQAAKSAADASKSEAGRFSLLDRYFGRPTYSQGEKTLDNLLVQNDRTAQPAFQQAQQGAQQSSNNFNDLSSRLTSYANQANAQTQQTKETAHKALGVDAAGNLIAGAPSPYADYQKSLADRATEYAKQQDADYSNLRGVASGPGSLEALAQYGAGQVNPNFVRPAIDSSTTSDWSSLVPKGNYAYGVDATPYVTKGVAPTAASVTQQTDLDRLAALNKLAGREVMPVGEVGSFDPTKDVGFDAQSFDAARTAAREHMNRDLSDYVANQWSPFDRPSSDAALAALLAKYGIRR